MTQAERQQLDDATTEIVGTVAATSATPREVAALVAGSSGIDEAVVRAALWDLLDRGQLELDASLHLNTGANAA